MQRSSSGLTLNGVSAADLALTRAEVQAVRAQFPAFARRVNGAPLVYLDSASTTQKPRAVIDALVRSYEETANIHRGVHTLSVEATEAYESVRGKGAALLGASEPEGDRLRPWDHRGDEPRRAELRQGERAPR